MTSLVVFLASVGLTGVVVKSSAFLQDVGSDAIDAAATMTDAALEIVSSSETMSQLGNAGLESIQSLSTLAESELVGLVRDSDLPAPNLSFLSGN